MIRWQYKTLTYAWDEEKKDLVWGDTREPVVNTHMVDKRLNELGDEGWELLCIEKVSDVSRVAVSFYLKRPKEIDDTPQHIEAPGSRIRKETAMEETTV